MQDQPSQVLDASASSQEQELRNLMRTIDPKLGGLLGIYNFGKNAVEAVMLGLSRPFSTTAEDVASLIKEWELRDDKCCYKGSMQDLFSLKNTFVVAISYKHEEEEHWKRKGQEFKSKFSHHDEALLAAAVEAISGQFNTMMVWCDQVLSTRLNDDEARFEWHHMGLLPYMVFPVLNLSAHVSKAVLNTRVWIIAERSLGSMAYGFFNAEDLARKIFIPHLGGGLNGWDCMKTICKHILSEYWPEALGRWNPDYHSMKKWALGVVCRGGGDYFNIPLFQKHDRVDNAEILSHTEKLAVIQDRMQGERPFVITTDKHFFLKATAFNVSLESIWEKNPRYVSHYMGRLGDAKFSWWKTRNSKVIFGSITCNSRLTIILALEENDGYRLFRSNGEYFFYEHAERIAGEKTKKQILLAAERAGIHLEADLEWDLLYCSDSSDLNDLDTPTEILTALGEQTETAEVLVAPVFRGSTTRLFKGMVAASGDNPADIACKMCECVKDWNEHVKSTYDNWVTVRDTRLGLVWIEGFTEKKLSFGFLEFITNSLLIKTSSFVENGVMLDDLKEVLMEINKLKAKMQDDQRCMVEEFFGTDDNENSRIKLTARDVARYTLCGGFTKEFFPQGFTAFLDSSARAWKYWQTMIVCRNGMMQIRFFDAAGEKRIAQRRTELENYTGKGIVHPDDYEEIKKISVSYDISDSWHMMMIYWNDGMEDTTTREEMWSVLRKSKRVYHGREVLLADMSIGESEEDRLLGNANYFRHGQDPFEMLKQIRTGEVSSAITVTKELLATYITKGERYFSILEEKVDRCRETQRQLREEEQRDMGQGSSE